MISTTKKTFVFTIALLVGIGCVPQAGAMQPNKKLLWTIGTTIGAMAASYCGYRLWSWYSWRTGMILLEAAEKGDLAGCRAALKWGANVNARDEIDWTPLHLACFRGDRDIVERLLIKGAKVDAKNDNGDTPLHLACHKGCWDIVKLLLGKGADVNAKNTSGFTPLCWAYANNNLDIVRLLIDNGAQITDKITKKYADLLDKGSF